MAFVSAIVLLDNDDNVRVVVDPAEIVEGGVGIPITLNPGDVLAQDAEGNELIELGEDNGAHDYVVKTNDLSGYWSVRNASDPENVLDVINAHEAGDMEVICKDGFAASPEGKRFDITTGYGFDDGNATPANGGDFKIQLGGGVNGGTDGIVDIRGAVSINKLLKLSPLADAPTPAEEGMIYADTDHHLYYYNGTTWKVLDNA